MKIIETIYDVATSKTEIIERDASAEELASHEKVLAERNAILAAIQQKEIARQLVLQKLGITEDEAKLLLS